MAKFVKIFFICLIAIFPSCGYQFGQGRLPSLYTSITVPYVEGDKDGFFTAELIKQLSLSGGFEYHRDCGALILKVVIIDFREENIDFRYDRNHEGRLTKSIIPTETRLTSIAEVVVIESASGKPILGPVRIAANVDFDHDYYSSRDGVNIFSLGQLSDYDEARDAAMTPLNRALAQKIVNYICDSW